jgi:Dihaem cytochrome c
MKHHQPNATRLTSATRLVLAGIGLGSTLLLLPALTWADRGERQEGREGREGRSAMPATPAPPAYQAECGSCHMAYPARLLPAASWQHLMTTLPRHYGSDASLDPPLAASLQTWLVANADTGRRRQADAAAPPEDRISRSAWFVREHREVAATTWTRPAIKSAANCSACHAGAERGDFDEHAVRIPR